MQQIYEDCSRTLLVTLRPSTLPGKPWQWSNAYGSLKGGSPVKWEAKPWTLLDPQP